MAIVPLRLVVIYALLAGSAHAGDSLSTLRACRADTDAARRLLCYDNAVDGLPVDGASARQSMPSPPSLATTPRPATAPTPTPTSPPAVTAAPAKPRAMLTAKVAAIGFRSSGAANITLDDGGIWAQYGPEGRVPLRVGDAVTVRPGLFGASILVGPTGWMTKVHPAP